MLIYSRFAGAKFWTALTIAACGLLLWNNSIYFDGSSSPRFLVEKGDWPANPWWLAAFYFHVVGASVCLVAGTPLMFPSWTRSHAAWHRRFGYVYLNAVLWMAAPAGLALAFTAKGGVWGATAFLLAGSLWLYTTWSGYQAIRRGNVSGHIRSMVRSYCWALSAPAFRAIQAFFFLCGLNDDLNYIVSLWLSVAASVWLAESFLYGGQRGMSAAAAVAFPRAGVIS